MILRPTFKEELFFWNKGFPFVMGVDEVGRGAFAGPVVAAAVVFSPYTEFKGKRNALLKKINDSKKLSPLWREKLSPLIKKSCLAYSIATIPVEIINKIGIGKSTEQAFTLATQNIIEKLSIQQPNNNQFSFFSLVDGHKVAQIDFLLVNNQKAIIKGDQKSISIAAASIIAKTHRDSLMTRLHKEYPQYGFLQNKGYGTLFHRLGIKKYGLSNIHRKSFNLSIYTTEII